MTKYITPTIIFLLLGSYFLYQKGFIFANFRSVTVEEAKNMLELDQNITLLDIRTPEELKEEGYIKGATFIPLSELAKKIEMLDRSKKVLVYCRSGNRSISASRILEKNDFVPVNMRGGLIDWKQKGYAVAFAKHPK